MINRLKKRQLSAPAKRDRVKVRQQDLRRLEKKAVGDAVAYLRDGSYRWAIEALAEAAEYKAKSEEAGASYG